MELETVVGVLVQEARELLAQMETALLEIEEQGISDDRINAVFRAAHTIKGSAGLFALDLIVGFTHVMEGVLVRVRNEELVLDAALCSLLLDSGDYMALLVDALEDGAHAIDPAPEVRETLLRALQSCLQTPLAMPADIAETGDTSAGGDGWLIRLRPSADLLRQGMDPLSFILYLERFGRIAAIATHFQALPSLADMDPESCYLGFDVVLHTAVDLETVRQTFDFIIDDCEVEILPLVADTPSPGEETPADASANAAANVAAVPAAIRGRTGSEQIMIKIEARKLDQLIDAVGEMVIATAGIHVLAAKNADTTLREALAELQQAVESIRDRSLNMRMTPVGDVFQRFPRVVRDVSRELDKKIELSISGADTELDKAMVEKLADPLMHIVRNALDHGIESTAERLAAGKSEHGNLRLNAFHESGCIVLEISDDGRGLNKARIRAKAQEKGLIPADAEMSDEETFALIFAAGFSTAEQVTDLSGRGVGMDVVRQNISQLRGTIDIRSTEGVGTTFRIQLPLTLAIIDGFQVAVGAANFILPLDLVEECVDISSRSGSHKLVSLRGEPLPLVELADIFEIERQSGGRQSMVVVRYGNRRAGILIDRFVGEMQAVIKPLGHLLRGVRGLGGSTILGDGSVALILDVPGLIERFARPAAKEGLASAA